MRIAGWTKFGYYPTPERLTPLIAATLDYAPYTVKDDVFSARIMDPCCGDGAAVAAFADLVQDRISAGLSDPEFEVRTYGVEIEDERARAARKLLTQVWHSDVDAMRFVPDSYDYLWLNPPYDWADQADTENTRLESRFLHQATVGLKTSGILIYIIPGHVLRWDADFLARHYDQIAVRRFPEPEFTDYGQVVVTAVKSPVRHTTPINQKRYLERAAQSISSAKPLQNNRITARIVGVAASPAGPPARRLLFSDREVRATLQAEGAWNAKEVRAQLTPQLDQTRMRPIEKLRDGHAAMVAANSMIDNVMIKAPDGDPIILRGFFKKVSRITATGEDTETRTDFFESNIRALNARTGVIQEMGSDPEGLANFMSTYGPAIRQQIEHAYPPSVDPDSPECQAIRRRLDTLRRPLMSRQADAATIGAAYLRDNKHLNLYFEPGGGKTCTSFAVAFGMRASKVAVMTPSRVVRNWIDEIQQIWPDSYIRVIDNQHPIARTSQSSEIAFGVKPPRVSRCSLEDARSMEAWATPDTPLWIILKKDTARRSHPSRHGMRIVGEPYEDTDPRDLPGNRPLRQLAEAERRAGARPQPPADSDNKIGKRHLYRDERGNLSIWDGPAEGTCPDCWFPLTDDGKWRYNDRDAVCTNPRPLREYPVNEEILQRETELDRERNRFTRGKYGGVWHSFGTTAERHRERERVPDMAKEATSRARQRTALNRFAVQQSADSELVLLSPRTCSAPIATAVRDTAGKAHYSYGDYLSERMNAWIDVFVIDEVQDYKTKETAQGATTRRIAQRAKKTIALTGTPFGGKVSEVFFLLSALNPGFGRHFGYHELGSFRRIYGREETTYRVDDGHSRSIGAASRRRETKQNTREIPGYHPALLEFFWGNTLFLELKDIDTIGALPPIRQRANLIQLDDHVADPLTKLSQKTGYNRLDAKMTQFVKASLQRGSKSSLGMYLQEMLTYPENAWQGTAPTDPETGDTIVEIDPLPAERLYPKEAALLELVRNEKAQGRKCLIYCTHTNRRDTVTRLMRLLKMHGIKALQLKAGTVDSEERSEWLQREAQNNDAIVCQPRLVETGVNLLDYPTIIWFEIEYSMYMTEQASRRSYRLTQTQPVDIYYLAYAGTMQERALRVIARKSDVSRTFHGDLSKTGLSAFNPDPDDIREQLARELVMMDTTSRDEDFDINDLLANQDRGEPSNEPTTIVMSDLSELGISRNYTRPKGSENAKQLALAF